MVVERLPSSNSNMDLGRTSSLRAMAEHGLAYYQLNRQEIDLDTPAPTGTPAFLECTSGLSKEILRRLALIGVAWGTIDHRQVYRDQAGRTIFNLTHRDLQNLYVLLLALHNEKQQTHIVSLSARLEYLKATFPPAERLPTLRTFLITLDIYMGDLQEVIRSGQLGLGNTNNYRILRVKRRFGGGPPDFRLLPVNLHEPRAVPPRYATDPDVLAQFQPLARKVNEARWAYHSLRCRGYKPLKHILADAGIRAYNVRRLPLAIPVFEAAGIAILSKRVSRGDSHLCRLIRPEQTTRALAFCKANSTGLVWLLSGSNPHARVAVTHT